LRCIVDYGAWAWNGDKRRFAGIRIGLFASDPRRGLRAAIHGVPVTLDDILLETEEKRF